MRQFLFADMGIFEGITRRWIIIAFYYSYIMVLLLKISILSPENYINSHPILLFWLTQITVHCLCQIYDIDKVQLAEKIAYQFELFWLEKTELDAIRLTDYHFLSRIGAPADFIIIFFKIKNTLQSCDHFGFFFN